MADSEPDSEAMIRWQANARESRTQANQHFLTYAAAILAIQTSILVSADTAHVRHPCLFVLAGTLAALSLVLGSAIVLLRLRDARLTARIARYRHTNQSPEQVAELRKAAKVYGDWTNRLIPCQVISFAVSAILLVVWVVSAHHEKLFASAA